MLFANAGIAEPKPTAAVSPEDYDKTFDINARGVIFAVHKVLPLMKEGGSIILTGSGIWQKGIPVYATYGATKAALRSFVRTWTAEFASKGIRANVISPGRVETPIVEDQFGENAAAMKERFKTMIPMGRMGKPEEIASAAVFLASDESSYITGIDLRLDGGNVANEPFFDHCASTRPPRGAGAPRGLPNPRSEVRGRFVLGSSAAEMVTSGD